jgi:N-acetylglucosamine-6-sulfatase
VSQDNRWVVSLQPNSFEGPGYRFSQHRGKARASRRIAAAILGTALAITLTPPVQQRLAAEEKLTDRPNILVVVTDDQRHGTLAMMPSTRANFATWFDTGIVNTPNCCPSRATIFSGLLSRNHGVESNGMAFEFQDEEPGSLAPRLQTLGYRTGFVGKYLNRSVRPGAPVPSGWDEFHGISWDDNMELITEGDIYTSFALRHFDGRMNETVAYPNERYPNPYSTRVLADIASGFIDRSHDPEVNPESKPWALFVFPYAPHYPYTVEPRYQGHPVAKWKRPPSFRERDMSDKPRQVRHSPMRNRLSGGISFGRIRQRQLRMLLTVDDLVGTLWDSIDGYGQRLNTWGIYTSDNGESWGEHHLGQKLHAYEESIRVHFRMAVPGTLGRRGGIASNLDIASTVLAITGSPGDSDGRSLVPFALGEKRMGRRRVLIENRAQVQWKGIRGPRWKYVKWPNGIEELYNLRRDPFELQNLATSAPQPLRRLRADLRAVERAHPRLPTQ